MNRWLLLALIALWLCLIAFTGVNIYRQHQLTKLQNKIIKDYQKLSEVPDIFKAKQEEIQKDIDLAQQQRQETGKPFPLKDSVANWLFLRLSAVFMTIVTIVIFWYYFRHQRLQE